MTFKCDDCIYTTCMIGAEEENYFFSLVLLRWDKVDGICMFSSELSIVSIINRYNSWNK